MSHPGNWNRHRREDGVSVVRMPGTIARWVAYWPDGRTMKRRDDHGYLFTPRFSTASAARKFADSADACAGEPGDRVPRQDQRSH